MLNKLFKRQCKFLCFYHDEEVYLDDIYYDVFKKFLNLFQNNKGSNNHSLFEIFNNYSLEYQDILIHSKRIRNTYSLINNENVRNYLKQYNGIIFLLQQNDRKEYTLNNIELLNKWCEKSVPLLIIFCKNKFDSIKNELDNEMKSYFCTLDNVLSKSERKYHIELDVIDLDKDISRMYVLLEWLFSICTM
ncbi:hypothetical protein ABK040_006084 [Willaertia magna]